MNTGFWDVIISESSPVMKNILTSLLLAAGVFALNPVDAKAADGAEKQFAAQKIGSKLKEGVLFKLDGSKFVDYAMTTVPEYYVVYYSGSW